VHGFASPVLGACNRMSRRTRGLIVPDCWLLLAERPEVTTIERLSLRGELHAPMRRYRRRDSEWIVGYSETREWRLVDEKVRRERRWTPAGETPG
jgi:hypothetical protein